LLNTDLLQHTLVITPSDAVGSNGDNASALITACGSHIYLTRSLYTAVQQRAHGKASREPGLNLYHERLTYYEIWPAAADILAHLKIKQGAHWLRKNSRLIDHPVASLFFPSLTA
jgi:hypothetical protein